MRKTLLIFLGALFLFGQWGCSSSPSRASENGGDSTSFQAAPLFEISMDLMESGAHFPVVDTLEYPLLHLPKSPMEPFRKVVEMRMSPQIRLLIIQEFFQQYLPENVIPEASGVKFYCITLSQKGEFIDQFPIAYLASEKQGESWLESRLMPDHTFYARGIDSPKSPILPPNQWVAYSKITESGKFEIASDYKELVESLAIASQNN